MAQRSRAGQWALILIPGGLLLGLLLFVGALGLLVLVLVASQSSGGCGTSVPISSPGSSTQSVKAGLAYLESQGISANGAAGIIGNAQQESNFNARSPGGGMFQWGGQRYSDMVSWVSAHGQDPNSDGGQLMYVVFDLRTRYATLLTELNSAGDPGTAATMFETTYELCSGVTGYLQVTPGSLCNDPARRQFAAQALGSGGSTVAQASLATGGTCVAVGGGGGDPIPGFRPSRDDMGVDGCANPGMPILAPADSQLVEILPGWYAGQPLMLLRFTQSQAGAQSAYWYIAEQIIPRSTTVGTIFRAGEPVATYAPIGTCIEIGWGSPTSSSRTLAGQMGDSAAANPPSGYLTKWGESFKSYFHIPWIGRSP